eukprot:CAMPEP_0171015232 /NCGR_PEP_ID=MMETSP0736-20130129/25780_1 /TAXON_ID=186038 /ORGANISM="Fragilariopsis kerguelensis, Strain L26-C5" /LENGTH=242 /DNA_ID=CAMNT_0011449969 /DNA_START=1 /DNA_END=726 /DNA_ORIENTATION=-
MRSVAAAAAAAGGGVVAVARTSIRRSEQNKSRSSNSTNNNVNNNKYVDVDVDFDDSDLHDNNLEDEDETDSDSDDDSDDDVDLRKNRKRKRGKQKSKRREKKNEISRSTKSTTSKKRRDVSTSSIVYTKGNNKKLNADNKRWKEKYQQLIAYKKKYRNTNVPRSYTVDPLLAKWINHQRDNYKNDALSNERIKQLNDIGFVWNVHTALWFGRYNELISYKQQHNNSTRVPTFYKENQKLSTW